MAEPFQAASLGARPEEPQHGGPLRDAAVPEQGDLGQGAGGLGQPRRVLEAVVPERDGLARGQAPGLPGHAEAEAVRLVDRGAGDLEGRLLRQDDPVDPVVRLEALDREARLRRGVERPRHRRIVRGDAVQERSQREDAGSRDAGGLDRVPEGEYGVGIVAREADGRHAVREVKARTELRDEMGVHVHEAGEQGAPAPVENSGAGRQRCRAHDDLADARSLHDDRRALDRTLRHAVEDARVPDDEHGHVVRAPPVAPRARPGWLPALAARRCASRETWTEREASPARGATTTARRSETPDRAAASLLRRRPHHEADQPAAASVSRGMMRRAAITGRGEVPMRSSPTIERSMYASSGSMPAPCATTSMAARVASSVASSINLLKDILVSANIITGNQSRGDLF